MRKLKMFILRQLGITAIQRKLDNVTNQEKELKKQTKSIAKQLEISKKKMNANHEQMKNVENLLRQLSEEVKRLQKANTTEHMTMKKELGKRVKDVDMKTRHIYSQTRALEMIARGELCSDSQETRRERIIVSMTSFPDRIRIVSRSLKSLMRQTMRPDKIVLWLSEDQFPDKEDELPYRLVEMKKLGLEIAWCKGDIKAYKKILPVLEKYPEDLVIITDDDLIYDIDFIETLYETHRKFPKAIIASRVNRVTYDDDGKINSYAKWELEVDTELFRESEDLFFTGGAGTLFPPKIFDKEIFNVDIIQQLCPYADDIWLNIMAARNNVSVINTGYNSHPLYIDGTQEKCLYQINKSENDVQLKKVVEYYRDELKDSIYAKL